MRQYYVRCMTKKENSDKSITIRIPSALFEKFFDKCNENYRNMSEALRLLILNWVNEDKK